MIPYQGIEISKDAYGTEAKNLTTKISKEVISQANAPSTTPRPLKIIPPIPVKNPKSIAKGINGKTIIFAGIATKEKLWK